MGQLWTMEMFKDHFFPNRASLTDPWVVPALKLKFALNGRGGGCDCGPPPPGEGGIGSIPKKNPGKKKGASTKCSNCIVRWLIDGFSKTDDNRWLNISFLAQSDEDEILLFEVSRAPSTRRGWIPLVGPHPLPLEKKSHRSFNTWDQTAEKIAKIANYENFWPPDSFFAILMWAVLDPVWTTHFGNLSRLAGKIVI